MIHTYIFKIHGTSYNILKYQPKILYSMVFKYNKERAYEWYRNNFLQTFKNWDTLMRAFLEKFKLKVEQNNAFIALFSLRQEKEEKINVYIR